MRSLRLAAALLAVALPLAAPLAAQETMSAEEFDAYTLGRTLSYGLQGTPYGIEEYLPNRRVRWAFVGQECQDGVWFERNGAICFIYDNAPSEQQCWTFFQTEDGLRGVYQGLDGPSTELYEVQQTNEPLTCQGPGVGV
jgi:hypothetical protein